MAKILKKQTKIIVEKRVKKRRDLIKIKKEKGSWRNKIAIRNE